MWELVQAHLQVKQLVKLTECFCSGIACMHTMQGKNMEERKDQLPKENPDKMRQGIAK